MTISEAFDQAALLDQPTAAQAIFLQAEMHLTLNLRHDFKTSFSPYAAVLVNGFRWRGITGNQASFKIALDAPFSGGILGGDADPNPANTTLLLYDYPLTAIEISLSKAIVTSVGTSPYTLSMAALFIDRVSHAQHKIRRSFFLNSDDAKTSKLAGFTKNTNAKKLGTPHFAEDESIPFGERSFLFLNILHVGLTEPPPVPK